MNKWNNSVLVMILVLLSACATQSKKETNEAVQKQPNVLFIAVDDLNDYLGCMGDVNAITPNIDRLASKGMLFTNAHCQAPLCGPSRASIMTGLRPSTTGIYGMIHDNEIRQDNEATSSVVYLPEYFKNNGYHTLGVGKIFHMFAPDGVFETTPGRFAGEKPNHNFGPIPEDKKRFKWEGYAAKNPKKYGRTSTDWGAFPEQDSEMPDYKATRWATNQLNNYNSDKPFFMAVGYLRPHVPLYVPQKWFDLYPTNKIKMPAYKPTDMNDIPDFVQNSINHLPMMPSTQWAYESGEWVNIVQAYLACVSFVDNQIGELLKALDESQYAENTIVVLWSDHGYRLGEKGTFAKHALWDKATRAPLIFVGPGIPVGKKYTEAAEMLSIYPTLLELCNLPAYERNEGISLMTIVHAENENLNTTAITTFGWKNHAVRTKDFRYILYEEGSEELYDEKVDPHEWKNLADDKSYESIKQELKSLLPKNNAKWNIHSNYTFQPYFVEQKKRVNK